MSARAADRSDDAALASHGPSAPGESPRSNASATPIDAAAVIAKYRAQAAAVADRLNRTSWRFDVLAYVRGGLFLAAVVAGICAWMDAERRTVWLVVGGLLAGAFLGVVWVHERLDVERQRLRITHRRLLWSIARCLRQWNQLPVIAFAVPAERRAVAGDLDLFGRASVFQWIGPLRTPPGIQLLGQWLCWPAEPAEIRARQAAVAELRDDEVFRDRLGLVCGLMAEGDSPDELVAWAEGPPWLGRRPWLVWVARLSALVVTGFVVGLLTSWITPVVAGFGLLAMMAINFFITIFVVGAIHAEFNRIAQRHADIAVYRELISLVAGHPVRSAWLKNCQSQLFGAEGDRGASAVAATNRLAGLVWLANLRRHGILFLLYVVVQFAWLWDVHALGWLERWKRRHGRSVRRWLDAIARFEVASALAEIAASHPDWSFPEIVDGPAEVSAEAMAHPLLDSRRVANDVAVGPPGTVLLVTGSNMSGKSTLLRAIGVNVVLAQMGSVAAARRMRLTPVWLETSMRVHDSLADGLSLFMAELRRLKEIVDAAGAREDRTGATTRSRPPLLYLLDEVLQGTNSRERHIAVSHVIERLVAHGAIGAVSTHDLDLVNAEGLRDACRPIHFRESFHDVDGQRQMTFDYRIHSGVSPTTNALELLRLVGLDDGSRGAPGQ
jgi:hypothetical protein